MSAPSTHVNARRQCSVQDNLETLSLRRQVSSLNAENRRMRHEIDAQDQYIATLEDKIRRQSSNISLPSVFDPGLATFFEDLVTRINEISSPSPVQPPASLPAPDRGTSTFMQGPSGAKSVATATNHTPSTTSSASPAAGQKSTSAQTASPPQILPQNTSTAAEDDEQKEEDRWLRRLRKHGIDMSDPAQRAVLYRFRRRRSESSEKEEAAANFTMTGIEGSPDAEELLKYLRVFPTLGEDRIFAISRTQRRRAGRPNSYIYDFSVKASRLDQIKASVIDAFLFMEMFLRADAKLSEDRSDQDLVVNVRQVVLKRYARLLDE